MSTTLDPGGLYRVCIERRLGRDRSISSNVIVGRRVTAYAVTVSVTARARVLPCIASKSISKTRLTVYRRGVEVSGAVP